MNIVRKQGKISIDEWRDLIISYPNLKTMSEWMGSLNENETYRQGVLYVGAIPYGRVMLYNGKLDIDISNSYLSIVHQPLSEIASKLESVFFYSSKIEFDETKHLPTTKIKINRAKTYFDNIEFPRTWMCIKSSTTDQILKELSISIHAKCKLSQINPNSNNVYCVREIEGLTILMGKTLLERISNKDNTLEFFSDTIIKKLKSMSKKYGEIQLFSESEELELISKFENGKTKLYDISFENKTYNKGKRNKSLQDLSPAEVSSIWSLNTEDLIFFDELNDKLIEIYR